MLFELGAHELVPWNKEIPLVQYEKSDWVVQKKIDVIGKKITEIIKRDPDEYYDGSLTVIVDSEIKIAHQTTNGDQLFIDYLH